MIILPVVTPASVVDQSVVNQAQQNQVESSQQSRKASDTVQLSPKALELAGAQVNESPTQQNSEVARSAENDADVDDRRAAAQASSPTSTSSTPPASNKIDVVA